MSQDNLAGLKKLQSDPALCSGHCHKEKASPGGHGCHDPRPHSPAGSWKRTCWMKCGEGGKADLAWQWDAVVIFDDNWQICQECEAWGIDAYQVSQKKAAKGAFPTFWKAVDAFLVGANAQ